MDVSSAASCMKIHALGTHHAPSVSLIFDILFPPFLGFPHYSCLHGMIISMGFFAFLASQIQKAAREQVRRGTGSSHGSRDLFPKTDLFYSGRSITLKIRSTNLTSFASAQQLTLWTTVSVFSWHLNRMSKPLIAVRKIAEISWNTHLAKPYQV